MNSSKAWINSDTPIYRPYDSCSNFVLTLHDQSFVEGSYAASIYNNYIVLKAKFSITSQKKFVLQQVKYRLIVDLDVVEQYSPSRPVQTVAKISLLFHFHFDMANNIVPESIESAR